MLDTLVQVKGGNPGGRRKYFLNDETTAKKLKAAADVPNIVVIPHGGSTTIHLSTGSYILTALPLLKAWMNIEGAYIEQEQVDGMIIGVNKIKTFVDLGGTIEKYEVKLTVEGQLVTVTLYDTTLKIFVQAGSMLDPYCNRVLIPYLTEEIKKASKKIEEINIKVRAVVIPKGTTRWQQNEFMKKASILENPPTLSSPRLRTLSSPSTPVTSVLALTSPSTRPTPLAPPLALTSPSTPRQETTDDLPSSPLFMPSPSSPMRTPGLLARAANWLPEVLSSSFLPSPRNPNQEVQVHKPPAPQANLRQTPVNLEAVPLNDANPLPDADPLPEAGPLPEAAPDPDEIPYPLLTSAGRLAMAHSPRSVTGGIIEKMATCYPCPVCDLVFSFKDSLTDHVENVHTGNIEVGQINSETSSLTASGRPIYLTPNFANKHTKMMKNFNLDHDDVSSESDESDDEAYSFKCDVCDYEVHSETGLAVHKDTVHKRDYVCEKCQYQAMTKNDLVGHMHIEHKEYISPCAVCGENQISISSLQVHILNNHCTQSDTIVQLLKRQEQMVIAIQQQMNYLALKQTCVIGDIKEMKQQQLASHTPGSLRVDPSVASFLTPVPAMTTATAPVPPSDPTTGPNQPAPLPSPQPLMDVEVPPTYADQVREAVHAETYNCTDCRYKCSSLTKLDHHIQNKHTRPNHGVPHTLLVCDSRVRSLKPRIVEKALRDGRLSVPGSLKVPEGPQGRGKGHPGRAYCSSRDWPGAKFPAASLEDRVPELLATGPFTNLVVQAPCNDITNILKVKDHGKHLELAALSAHNTLTVVERALRVTPSLEKAVILEQLPRTDNDHLSALAQYSTTVLREAVINSSLKNKIIIASPKSLECKTEEDIVNLFGPRDSPRSDGVHLVGEHGRQMYTDFILDSLKSAKLAWTSPVPRAGPRQGRQGPLATSNRFQALSN